MTTRSKDASSPVNFEKDAADAGAVRQFGRNTYV